MVWVRVLKSRYMLEYTLFNMLLISVCFFSIFIFLIKNGIQSVRQHVLLCTVTQSLYAKFSIESKAAAFSPHLFLRSQNNFQL